MRLALSPVETRGRESPARCAGRVDVDSPPHERARARGGELVTRPAVRSRARWVDTRGCARFSREARSLTVASRSSRALTIATRDVSPRAAATRAAFCIDGCMDVVYRASTYLYV